MAQSLDHQITLRSSPGAGSTFTASAGRRGSSARLSRAAKQTIFAFAPAALGLLALILTAAAVQIVGAQLFRDASEIAGFAPRY